MQNPVSIHADRLFLVGYTVTGLGNFPYNTTTTTVCRHEKVKNCPFLLIFTLSLVVCARACACARGYASNFIYFLRYSHPSKAASKSCLILSSSFLTGISGINFKKVSREKDCTFSPCVDNRGHFSPLFHPQNEVQKHENSSSGDYRFHYGLLDVLPGHAFHGSILIPSPRICDNLTPESPAHSMRGFFSYPRI